MIFASDLDRTLIYSKKFVKEDMKNIRLIETKEEESISYMTEKAIDQLKELSKKASFIPVTTRTIAQYKRIHLFRDEIKPKYAITSNGGNIIINGEVDTNWNEKIRKSIGADSLATEDVLKKFEDIKSDTWLLKSHIAEDLFHYFIVDRENVPLKELETFSDFLNENNWKTSLQGRKLYFVPQCVCKWKALEYIKDREEETFIASAGDSLLDLPMLKMADYAVVPKHGEIYKFYEKGKDDHIIFTESEGIIAAEEILQKIIGCTK
ncbi:hypothetical protein IZY60_02585 [Lutibacter sp. B2]|nr:hypothetical protein [Lutibacter sp. B2]